jgi:tetratricopeptide (TPR) repeat protein
MAFATIGQPETARRLLAEHEATPEADHAREARAWIEVLALTERRYGEAISSLRQFDEQSDCSTCAGAWLARTYDLDGQSDSAIAIYERFVNKPSSSVWYDAGHLSHGYYRLAEISEAKGDRRRAAEYYTRFVDLWSGADAQFQPQVRRAREALTRVTSEPSKSRE